MENKHCRNCANLYVTYKAKFPYGCKAFGIISKNIPYLEVKKISGTDCALFSLKKNNVKLKKRGRLA